MIHSFFYDFDGLEIKYRFSCKNNEKNAFFQLFDLLCFKKVAQVSQVQYLVIDKGIFL